MRAMIEQFFNVNIMWQAAPLIFRGLLWTLMLCAVAVPLGFLAGVVIAAFGTSRYKSVRGLVVIYVDLLRSIPPLVLLILISSALPFAGIRLSPLAAVLLGLTLNSSSFYGEIVRAGIESIGSGQWYAARSTGLSHGQSLLYVILPQALRNVLPDLASNTLEVIKLTALASVVSFQELLYSADMARSVSYNSSPITLAAMIYLALLWPLVRLIGRLESGIAA
jgi:polar amino acid transport system permease protein